MPKTITLFQRFERFQHDKVLKSKNICHLEKGHYCIPVFNDPECRKCEEKISRTGDN